MLCLNEAFALNPSPSTSPSVATETITASVYRKDLWPLQLHKPNNFFNTVPHQPAPFLYIFIYFEKTIGMKIMVTDTGLLHGRIPILRQVTWARNKALELEHHQRKVCYTREQPAHRFSTEIHEAFVKYTVSGYFILPNLSVSAFDCLFFFPFTVSWYRF